NTVSAQTAPFCEPRPINNSASKIGRAMKIVRRMKIRKNAPPPDIPLMYGNFHIAPRPIADPAAAKIKPNFDVHCSFDCFMIDSLIYNLKNRYYYIDY